MSLYSTKSEGSKFYEVLEVIQFWKAFSSVYKKFSRPFRLMAVEVAASVLYPLDSNVLKCICNRKVSTD